MSSPAAPVSQPHAPHAPTAALVLGALGVVFGDIGTSPLYALKECFSPEHGIAPTPENVMGLLSLITWSMAWVIAFKYLSVMMRADNDGEGGILALTALVASQTETLAVQWTGDFVFALLCWCWCCRSARSACSTC